MCCYYNSGYLEELLVNERGREGVNEVRYTEHHSLSLQPN